MDSGSWVVERRDCKGSKQQYWSKYYFHVKDFCRLDGADEPRLSLFITHVTAGYPLNHVFYLWFALLDTSDIGSVLLLLIFFMIVACTALVKFGIAQLSHLGSLKAESKEQTTLKKIFLQL